MSAGVNVRARAKLNLSLDVLAKRPDGFHDMLMVMQSAELCDDVNVELTGDGRVFVATDLPYIPSDERNVAFKAAHAFFAAADMSESGASIRITKRIPVCAGLGGGSSDAAAVLCALNELAGNPLTAGALRRIAAHVGSDVPFCVEGGTALAEGRGERLRDLRPMPALDTVICMPHFSCSTPELFCRVDSRVSRCRPDTAGMLEAIERADTGGAARRMYNVFEDVLDKRSQKTVREIKSRLIDAGALGAVMSGSGSAVFGLFPDAGSAGNAAEAMKSVCREVFLTRLSEKNPCAGL